MRKKALISIHDITPHHFDNIRKAEALMVSWGVSKINFLFVPDYHRKNSTRDEALSERFHTWLKQKRPFAHDWLLHGYYHREYESNGDMALSPKDWLKRHYLTAGEGEFLSLSKYEIMSRLDKARILFQQAFNRPPDTFAPPAWLYNTDLIHCLKEKNFAYFEDHRNIYFLKQNRRLAAPVITWASRTALRKITSRIGCPPLYRLWSRNPLLRIAVHPPDFDHPSLIRSIKRVIDDVLKNRDLLLYKELDSER